MEEHCRVCSFEKVASVQFGSLGEDLKELKARVGRLESTLGRGVMLLVANLVGVVVTLARELL